MLTGFKSTVAIGKLLGWDVIPLDFHNYSYHGQIYPGYEVGYGQNVYSADFSVLATGSKAEIWQY